MSSLIKGRVMVSGGFDPLHQGHLRFMAAARSQGSNLIAVVESDAWVAKKHRVLLPMTARLELVAGLKHVDLSLPNNDESGNCSGMVRLLKPEVYAVGPDHVALQELPEYAACNEMGVTMLRIADVEKFSSTELLTKFDAPKWDNPPVTASVIVVDGGNVLLGRRVAEDSNGVLDLLGGFVEMGESLEDAARREAEEESGVKLFNVRYFGSRTAVYSDGRKILSTYFTANAHGAPVPTVEMSGFVWTNRTPEKMHADCDREMLDRYFTGGSP